MSIWDDPELAPESNGDQSAQVVPLGKYKGQPVQTLLADPEYRDWLLSQPWFPQRYAAFYQTVINYGGPPQDSPEHNEMQAEFLDDDWCLRLARLLYPSRTFGQKEIKWSDVDRQRYGRFRRHLSDLQFAPPAVFDRQFEDHGWDVTYSIDPASATIDVLSLPDCACGPCDHSDCLNPPCDDGNRVWGCHHRGHSERFTPPHEWLTTVKTRDLHKATYATSAHCADDCPWGDSDSVKWLLWPPPDVRWYQPAISGCIRVELKPDLGDDFPKVLRQIGNYPTEYRDRRCLLVRRAQFERVSWEQVTKIFAASEIRLIRTAEIDATD